MDRFEDYGFKADNNLLEFNNIFDNKNISEIHLDTYLNDPYILLSRIVENNVSSSVHNNRLILRKKDRNKTILTDIPFDSIDQCMIKRYSDSHYQIICAILNVYYKILVII